MTTPTLSFGPDRHLTKLKVKLRVGEEVGTQLFVVLLAGLSTVKQGH